MLDRIRKYGHSIWFKGLMIVLLASFALSGVTAGFQANLDDNYMVKVGKYKIYPSTVDRKLQERMDELSAAGLKLNEEQLQSLGINKPAALNELVQQSLAEQEVEDMNLSVDDKVVAQEIKKLPWLQKNGVYDVEQLRVVLYKRGLHEKQFVNNIRESVAQGMLMDSLTLNLPLPELLATASLKQYVQKRDIEYITVPKGYDKLDKVPNEEDLKTYFFENSVQFEIPETRKIEYVVLPKNTDREKEYEAVTKIEDDLAAGSTLDEIAKKQGLKKEVAEKFTKDDEKFSDKFTEIALNASENEPTQVVEDENGSYFVVNVLSIEDARIPELEEVKDKVIAAWHEHEQKNRDVVFANEIFEKAKKEGNLQKTADEYGLPIEKLPGLTRNSQNIDFDMVLSAYSAKPEEVFGVYDDGNGGFKVARLVAIHDIEPSEADRQKYAENLKQSVSNDILDQYFTYLRTKYPVKTNPKLNELK